MGIQIAYVLSDVKLVLVVNIGMERQRMVLNKEALYGLKGVGFSSMIRPIYVISHFK